MNFLDLFEYEVRATDATPIVVYFGVRLLKDLDWDHGEELEAVYNTETGRLDIQEWLDEAQVVNQKTVRVGRVHPLP